MFTFTRVVQKVREQLRTFILAVFSCFIVTIQHFTIIFSNFCTNYFNLRKEKTSVVFLINVSETFCFSIFRLSLELFNLLNFIVYAFINVV